MRELSDLYGEDKLAILAFPCNQFANQEPGTEKEICEFVGSQKVKGLHLFDKVKVNGKETHPLFKFLKEKCPGILHTESIKWNFTKFLVDENGKPIKRFGPNEKFTSMKPDIEKLVSSG
jgi:glutathione peroxidase-family protein